MIFGKDKAQLKTQYNIFGFGQKGKLSEKFLWSMCNSVVHKTEGCTNIFKVAVLENWKKKRNKNG